MTVPAHPPTAMPDPSRPFEVQLSLSVKTYDIDFAGIVSNIVYIRWLEDLRIKMIEQTWPIQTQLTANIAPVLSETNIRYQHPVTLHDELYGRMWMSRLKQLKWMVSAEFYVADRLVAIATQSGCFIDLSHRKPIRVPARILSDYETWEK
ncbi:MAG: thioesterase family protein [Cyanobacteria bacterium P01_A01_bin.114]